MFFRALFLRTEVLVNDTRTILGFAGVAAVAGGGLYTLRGGPIVVWAAVITAVCAVLGTAMLLSILTARLISKEAIDKWNDLPNGDEKPPRPSSRRHHLTAVVVIVFCLGIGLTVIYGVPVNSPISNPLVQTAQVEKAAAPSPNPIDQPSIPKKQKTREESRPPSPAKSKVEAQPVEAPTAPPVAQSLVIQNAPQGMNIGPGAKVNNPIIINNGPPQLSMSDGQKSNLITLMAPYAGKKFDLSRHSATDDSSSFADDLREALKAAGLIVGRDRTETAYPIGGAIPSGVSMDVGENNMDAGIALAKAAFSNGWTGGKPTTLGRHKSPEMFYITVAPLR